VFTHYHNRSSSKHATHVHVNPDPDVLDALDMLDVAKAVNVADLVDVEERWI